MGSASLLVKFFGLAFSALLPVINPLGSALMFLGLVGPADSSVYRNLARKIAISTTLFLVVVELVGTALLAFFGISLPVVQVAGGLVLATMGWNLLNQQNADQQPSQASAAAAAASQPLDQEVFYPLTFPITAGPGCIVVTLTLSAHASAKAVLPNFMGHLGIVVAIAALSLTVFLSYAYAPRITARISPQTAHGILRVIAFVLLCIGVQITWNGVETLLRTVLHS
jgi:multiple antibiotic resistance protein